MMRVVEEKYPPTDEDSEVGGYSSLSYRSLVFSSLVSAVNRNQQSQDKHK